MDNIGLTLFEIAIGDSVDDKTYEQLRDAGYVDRGRYTDLAEPHMGKIFASLTPAGVKHIRTILIKAQQSEIKKEVS